MMVNEETKRLRRFMMSVGLGAIVFATVAYAATVEQGAGSFNVTPWFTNNAAKSSALVTECIVLNSASTTCPTTALVGRRSIEVQNVGPNPIWCRPDSTAAVVQKARRLAQFESWSVDISDVKTMRCIASTGDQVTTAATIVTEVK